jgi:Glycosyl transferases group 1
MIRFLLFLQVSLFFASINGYQKSTPHHILILYSGIPELEWIKRIERACHHLEWKCSSLFCGNFPIEELGLKPADPDKIAQCIEKIDPDFTISLWDNKIFSNHCPNYLCITGGTMRFHRPEIDISEIFNFNGILYSTEEIDFLKGFFLASGKEFRSIKWYPSCENTEFKELIFKKLFCCGNAWGENREGEEYKKLFSLLDQREWLAVYGPKERWAFVSNSAKGFLPVDGISIRKAIQEAGIALVIHSNWHLDVGAPSSRIFEAAAASAIIISDKHPFIIKEFGDSVLYFDQNQSGENMYQQIAEHIESILSHPTEATEMAKRAHQIFIDKYTLEDQLKNLSDFYERTH